MPYKHVIDDRRCKGCGLCLTVCPKKVLEISRQVNSSGFFPAVMAREAECTYCGLCCTICPDVAISIEEESEDHLHAQVEKDGYKWQRF